LTDLPKVDESAFAAIDGLIAPPIFLKLEGGNPAGSVKYKTALGLLDAAERDGSLRRDSILIESSSRSAGVALAMLCAPHGYHCASVILVRIESDPSLRTYYHQINDLSACEYSADFVHTA